MPKNVSRYYWLCQIGGWGIIALFIIVIETYLPESKTPVDLKYIFTALYVIPGLIGTHLFREVIRRSGWLQLPVEKDLPKFLIGILFTCLGCGLIRIGAIDMLGLNHTKKAPDFLPELMASTAEFGFPIIPWTLIYYF